MYFVKVFEIFYFPSSCYFKGNKHLKEWGDRTGINKTYVVSFWITENWILRVAEADRNGKQMFLSDSVRKGFSVLWLTTPLGMKSPSTGVMKTQITIRNTIIKYRYVHYRKTTVMMPQQKEVYGWRSPQYEELKERVSVLQSTIR